MKIFTEKIAFVSSYGSDELIKDYYTDINFDDVDFMSVNSITDGVSVIKYQKADAFVIDGLLAKELISRNPELMIADFNFPPMEYVYAFRKEDTLADKIRDAIDQLKKAGTIDSLVKKWTSGDPAPKTLGEQDWDVPNGSFLFGGESGDEALFYLQEDKFIGLDMDIMYHVAKMLQMKVEVRKTSYDALLIALQKHKVDVIGSGLVYLKEAGDEINYSVPYLDATSVLLVKKPFSSQNISLWESFKSSVEKNFIRESRWKTILSDIKISLLISITSGIIGFILGFGLCMLRRSQNKLSRASNILIVNLVQGTPIVVLLMIVYYVIFRKHRYSGRHRCHYRIFHQLRRLYFGDDPQRFGNDRQRANRSQLRSGIQ